MNTYLLCGAAVLLSGCVDSAQLSSPGASGGNGGRNTGGIGNGNTGGTSGGSSGGSSVGGSGAGGTGAVSAKDLRVDHFGYLAQATKRAVIRGSDQVDAELRNAADDSVVTTVVSSAFQTDEDSGDQYSTADFSTITTPGEYYVNLPSLGIRSYTFQIGNDVYDIVGAVAMKSFYYQRCNQDRALPYASDAIQPFPGIGGQWVDGACHAADYQLGPGPNSANDGRLDLHGGWHDAGDYQKTLWDRGVEHMLFAYELNPNAWKDGQLNIPESGNGVPDILDELAWELDFYVRMQRPDGHFLTSAKGHNATVNSPPSASNEQRVYFDGTSPSSSEWSGGGVTRTQATANAVRALAHAAVVFEPVQPTAAAGYRAAALNGWTWLSGTTSGDRRLRVAAAAAVYRMDPSVQSAAQTVQSFNWTTWDGLLPNSVTPAEGVISVAAWNTLLNTAASASLQATIRTAAARAVVDRAWAQRGIYGGMYGGPGNVWDFSWGSNRNTSVYGANLLIAARFGIVSSHTQQEVEEQGQRYLHYMLGLNPMNMVYLTNMAAYGGEHSSFQIYHSWFSFTGRDGDHGNTKYNGLPSSVSEPAYPYYRDDNQTSQYGPAPGLVPGGPNSAYSGTYIIPNRQYPAYAYRDWSVGCAWNGSACASASWEITEPSNGYEGPFILLVSLLMSGK